MTTRRRLLIALLAGFFIGVLWLIGVRYFTYSDDRVHYHANFALYINGEKDEFNSATFYEETQSCSADEIGPKSRVHMHDQESDVVHVHDDGATWGHLFANLGYSLGNTNIQTDSGVYVDKESDKELTFILNGKKVSAIANETIDSEDVLLINYGKESKDDLQERYESVSKNAAEYNQKSDPSACAGSKPLTFTDRLKEAIGLNL